MLRRDCGANSGEEKILVLFELPGFDVYIYLYINYQELGVLMTV